MTEPLIVEEGPIFRAPPGWQWRRDPPSPYAFLDYSQRPMPEHIAAFMEAEKEPMDLASMGLMLQAAVEAGMADRLDLAAYRAVVHFAAAGLVTMNGRVLQ